MTKTVPIAPNHVTIALVAYEGVQMSAVLGIGDLLDVANRFALATGGKQIGYAIVRAGDLHLTSQFDAVVLPPNLNGKRGQSDRLLHAWLTDQHRVGATICSACAGAFWLGHAGILDGRPVTTHWGLEE